MRQSFRTIWVVVLAFFLTMGQTNAVNHDKLVTNWLKTFSSPYGIGNQSIKRSLQSASVQKTRLDSLILITFPDEDSTYIKNHQTMVFQYNAYGLLVEYTHLSDFDGVGFLTPQERTVSTYDAYGHKTSDSIYAHWSQTSELYLIEIKEYRYSPKGILLMENSKKRGFETSKWNEGVGEEYVYDVNERLVVQKTYNFSDEGIWELVRKKDFGYDVSGNLNSDILYYWDANSKTWIGMDKNEHFFNEHHLDTLTQSYSYYPLETRWALRNRTVNHYDATGHLMQRFDDIYDQSKFVWVQNAKTDYTYDAFGNRIMGEKAVLYSGLWEAQSKFMRKFDSLGNLVSDTTFTDLGESDRTYAEITDYRYKPQETLDNALWPITPEEIPIYHNLPTDMNLTVYIPSLDTSMATFKVYFYYSLMEVLGTSTTQEIKPNWYYQASTQSLFLKPISSKFMVWVYDLQGRCLLQQAVSDRLSLSGLSKGLYVIRVESALGVERGKVMVE